MVRSKSHTRALLGLAGLSLSVSACGAPASGVAHAPMSLPAGDSGAAPDLAADPAVDLAADPSVELAANPAVDFAADGDVQALATSYLYVSTSGNDSNSGTSSTAPLRTINKAAAKAKPGTVILISPGTYYERVITKVAGSSGAPIVFKGNGGVPTIDGSRYSWSSKSVNYGMFEVHHNYTTLDRLKIVNSATSGVVLNADNVQVLNSEVAYIQNHGITNRTNRKPDLGYPLIKNITVKYCKVHDTVLSRLGQGISIAADRFLVAGNQVWGTRDIGIDLWTGAKHGEVVGNIVRDNPGDGASNIGIYVDGGSHIRIHRNKVYRNGKGIFVTSEDPNYYTSYIQVYNNVVYDHVNGPGLGVWDDTPVRAGTQNVLIANNTAVNNKYTLYLSGTKHTAEIMNNVGYGTSGSVSNSTSGSTFKIHHNVWLSSATGFVSASGKDFRLTSSSPARDKGAAIPSFKDDLGKTYSVTTDFLNLKRVVGSYPDAGAYEYQ